ncbi:MAG TPA: urea amidolyase [Alphaproteobacteria bacterium]|nr:urea amidolyase [Alphaproteobacteria bacterium]|tara:strand:+ start:896 stop:1900 length:1005 start_codon:yes stop_codon:yes gene_type:complete
MRCGLEILNIGPAATVQDLGRQGYLAYGLSASGVSDRDALYEGAAILQQDVNNAVLEMSMMGGSFRVHGQVRAAVTGARMSIKVGQKSQPMNTSFLLHDGDILEIGGCEDGIFGYLHLGGGIQAPQVLGSRATHLFASIGAKLEVGHWLERGEDPVAFAALQLETERRGAGGKLRFVRSFQTDLFGEHNLQRFLSTKFSKTQRSNRMGVGLQFEGEGFQTENQLHILSEVITVGDVQMTGDGQPFILMQECQSTGGYPRIGTVLAPDLVKVAQAPTGTIFQFSLVDFEEAAQILRARQGAWRALPQKTQYVTRKLENIDNLLEYNLVDGVISAT